jgi:hypothetical protein
MRILFGQYSMLDYSMFYVHVNVLTGYLCNRISVSLHAHS